MKKITVDGKPVKQWAEERVTKENAMPTPPTHTKTPWKVDDTAIYVDDPKWGTANIATVRDPNDGMHRTEVGLANATFIVRAVNAYDPMMDLLDKVARSACLNQEVSGKCVCFSCQANKLIGVKQ